MKDIDLTLEKVTDEQNRQFLMNLFDIKEEDLNEDADLITIKRVIKHFEFIKKTEGIEVQKRPV